MTSRLVLFVRNHTLFLIFVFLFIINVGNYYLDGVFQTLFILLAYLCLFFAYKLHAFKLDQIGLGKDSFKRGLKVSLLLSSVIVLMLSIAYVVSPSIFMDSRFDDTLSMSLFQALIVLPFYTVVLEEIVFRGILPFLLSSKYKHQQSMLLSSLIFGLWHVLASTQMSISSLPIIGQPPQILVTIVVVIATGFVGYILTWLRYKYDSLYVPIILHWVLNGTGILLAGLAWKI